MPHKELDTFEDGPYSGDEDFNDSVESFEDTEDVEDYHKQESFDDETEEQDSEDSSVQTKKSKEIDKESQVNLLEDQEEKRIKEEAEKSDKTDENDKKSDEDDKSKSSEEDDASKDDGDSTENVRKIKAFREGRAYEIPEDAQVSVKINGKSEKVTLTDLRDNYSGKVAYEEKFNTLSEEKKGFEAERDQYQEEIASVSKEMATIREKVIAAQKGEADPLEGFNYLLDLMGVNSIEYSKQMQDALYSQFEIFQEMTDSERDNYWLQKENKYLTERRESERSKSQATEANREQQARINEFREAQGISEDDFNSAYQDLLDQGTENITAEQVAQFAKLTPLMDASEEIMSKYEDQLGTDKMNEMVRDVAVAMYEDSSLTIEDVKSILAEELEVETLLSEVTKNKDPEELAYKSTKQASQKYEYESFDDWD